MARPRYLPNRQRPDALSLFVDRDEPRAIVRRAVKAIPTDKAEQILTFYGVGGQGKSLLCRKIEQTIGEEKEFSNIRVALVDLAIHPEREPISLLIWLRNALMKAGKVRLLAFDLAFELYRVEAQKGAALPQLDTPWTEWTTDLFTDGTVDSVANAAAEGAGALCEGVPFVGAVLKKVGKHYLRKGMEWRVKHANKCLECLYDKGQLVEKKDFEQRLVYIFSQSLEKWREDHPDEKFLFLIDEYERILECGGVGSKYGENTFDAMMRDIVASCDASLFILFSREKLHWDEIWPDDWADALKDRQHFLGGLARSDAERFLIAANVKDAALREAMLNAASVETDGEIQAYPLLLELCVQLYESLIFDEKAVAPSDFAVPSTAFTGKRADLAARLLRSFKRPDLEWTLKHLSVARHFDRPLFEFVVEHCNTKMPHSDWTYLTQMSMVSRLSDGSGYTFYNAIRETFESLLPPEELSRTRELLIEYYSRDIDRIEEIAKSDWDHAATIAKNACEAFFQKTKSDGKAALRWWNRECQSLHAAGFARLIETVDRDCIPQAEKIFGKESDWVTSQCAWLAANLDDQSRHGEAEPLHRRDLAISEKVLGPEHRDTAASLSNLAYNLDCQGRHGEAEPLHRRDLAISEKVLGPEHRDTATSLSKLAYNLDCQGRHGEAEPLHRRALTIDEKVLGPEHRDTATCLSKLATNLDCQGRHGEAEPLHERAETNSSPETRCATSPPRPHNGLAGDQPARIGQRGTSPYAGSQGGGHTGKGHTPDACLAAGTHQISRELRTYAPKRSSQRVQNPSNRFQNTLCRFLASERAVTQSARDRNPRPPSPRLPPSSTPSQRTSILVERRIQYSPPPFVCAIKQ